MQADIDVRSMEAAGQELLDTGVELKRLAGELESVKRKLASQTEFRKHCSRLRETGEAMWEADRKLKNLTLAMDNIGLLYRRTETSIEERFETGFSEKEAAESGKIDLSGIGDRVNALLNRR